MRLRIAAPQFGNQIFEVVVKLAVIADIAARAGFAVAPHVRRHHQVILGGEPFGDFIRSGRMAGRAVDDDCDVLAAAVGGRIEPIGKP